MDSETLAKVLGFLLPWFAAIGYLSGYCVGWKSCSKFWRRELGLPEKGEK